MAQETWTIHIDGGSRGNPGPAASAYIITRPGQPDWEESFCLGRTTNNIAEYTALIRALERAQQLQGRRLTIFSDSELLVKQMNGQYRVKNADLKELFEQAQELKKEFERVTIKHVYREENQRADELCNEALDGSPTEPPVELAGSVKATRIDPRQMAHDEALACLGASAVAWADGNPNIPDPAAVWQQLQDILKKHGII